MRTQEFSSARRRFRRALLPRRAAAVGAPAGAVVAAAPPLWARAVGVVRLLRAGAVVVAAPPLPADFFVRGAPPLRAGSLSSSRRRCARATFLLVRGPPFWATTMSSPEDHPPMGVDDVNVLLVDLTAA